MIGGYQPPVTTLGVEYRKATFERPGTIIQIQKITARAEAHLSDCGACDYGLLRRTMGVALQPHRKLDALDPKCGAHDFGAQAFRSFTAEHIDHGRSLRR